MLRFIDNLKLPQWAERYSGIKTFGWFERRIDPFPMDRIETPPDKLVPFFWHYIKPVWWAFAMLTVTTLLSREPSLAL